MRPGFQRAIVAVTTMMTTFLVMLDMTIANVALDHMRGTLSAGVDEITWVLTSFLVANAISLPVSGWLSDLLGRKRLFIVATVAFTITSGVCGAAPSLIVIVLMRFLQGLSIAETAQVLGRSDGAVKQLQLRGVRNLAKLLPEGLRDR